jgi:hypothetical protein
MKKSFIFKSAIFLFFLTGTFLVADQRPSAEEFEKFLESLFPGGKAPEELKKPGKKPPTIAKKVGAEKVKVEEIKPVEIDKFNRLRKKVESILKSSKGAYFDPTFREKIIKINFDNFGEAIAKILDRDVKKIYAQILGEKEFLSVFESLSQILADAESITLQIRNIKNDTDLEVEQIRKILESKLGKKFPTKEDVINEVYIQKTLPPEERIVQGFSQNIRTRKGILQTQILNFSRQKLPEVTVKINSFVKKAEPTVSKKLEAEKIPVSKERPERDFPYRRRDDDRYPDRRRYDRDRDDRETDRGPEPDYGPPREDVGREEIAKAPEKEDDKDKYIKAKKEKEKKEKDEKEEIAKTDLITLMNEVPRLLQTICGPIAMKTSVLDEKVVEQLAGNSEQCIRLKNIVAEIEKRKNTPKAKEDKKLRTWKPAEKAYHGAIVKYSTAIIKLAKFYIPKHEHLEEIVQSSDALKSTYKMARKAITDRGGASRERMQKEIKTKEKRVEKNIITDCKKIAEESFKIMLSLDENRKYALTTDILAIDSPETLTRTVQEISKLIQIFTIARREPIKIILDDKNLAFTQDEINQNKSTIFKIFRFARGKYSRQLDKEDIPKIGGIDDARRQFDKIKIDISKLLKRAKRHEAFEEFIFPIAQRGSRMLPAPERRPRRWDFNYEVNEVLLAQFRGVTNLDVIRLNLFIVNLNLLEDIKNLSARLITEFDNHPKFKMVKPARPKIEVLEAFWARIDIDRRNKITIQSLPDIRTCAKRTSDC